MRGSAAAGLGAGAAALSGLAAQDVGSEALQWHREADVVVVGSGASGMPAAIRARNRGATVIVVEENYDSGGHGIISALSGSRQRHVRRARAHAPATGVTRRPPPLPDVSEDVVAERRVDGQEPLLEAPAVRRANQHVVVVA